MLRSLISPTRITTLSVILSFQIPVIAENKTLNEEKEIIDTTHKKLENTPADMLFQAHLKLRAAEKVEQKGKFNTAWNNYFSALKYYQLIKHGHPQWKPNVIEFRIKDINKRLNKLKSKITVICEDNSKATIDLESLKKKISDLKKVLSKNSSDSLKTDIETYKNELAKRSEELKIISQALLKSERKAASYKKKMEEMIDQLAKSKNGKSTAQ